MDDYTKQRDAIEYLRRCGLLIESGTNSEPKTLAASSNIEIVSSAGMDSELWIFGSFLC